MTDITQAALLKVERANRHFRELEACVKAFAESEFYSISKDIDPCSGNPCARVSINPLPKEVPLMIGDTIHNLRSALDFVWTEMVRQLGRTDANQHFPFHEKRDDLERRVLQDEKVVVPAVPAVGKVLVNDIKPYKAGNISLWAMNVLDRADKHRLLIASANITGFPHIALIDKNRNNTFYQGKVLPSGIVHISGAFPGLEIEEISYGKPSIVVVFDIDPVRGRHVFPGLTSMGRETERAIRLIGDAWIASGH